jgi:hypothetical protein
MISKIISREACLRELASNPKSFSNCPDLHGGVPDLARDRIRSKPAVGKKSRHAGNCNACALKFDYALVVAHHVNDHAVRVLNKEPADAPRLIRWIARRDERDNPIHVHSHVKAQETRVELPALMNLVAGDIWYNSSDAHRIPFFLVRSNLQIS